MKEVNNFDNDEVIKGHLTLKSDKDIIELLKISNLSGVPLVFKGDRIVDFKIDGISGLNNFKPDKISIGPAAFHFDLKFGKLDFNKVPFDKKMISEDIIIFEPSIYANIDFNVKLKIIRSDNYRFNINISPKSNKISDILNYEVLKKNAFNNDFELKISDENIRLYKGKLPIGGIDEDELKFFTQVNKINEELHLNILIDEDYVIRNKDFEIADSLCEFIKNKKIEIENINISISSKASDLSKFLNEGKEVLVEEKNYKVKLLNNEINLGACKVFIKEHKLINFNEIKKLYDENKDNEDIISTEIMLKDLNSEKLYIDFNI